ncbi:FtsX-like permease family protein [Streptomyces sp. G-G2]|uniref:ABC transporter permease n=1 Tax=Streptomyces sp. G-G2 TaxID=3046201 RepID=UPI0024BB6F37|nr:FtsX-like permease family protein [Streptomyces sp. G-G2]MDJ0380624.1 FtsX-like permease family protein [Streptomyces sp. G-G2]
MFRTALRNVLAHKARLLMTVLAVTLGVAFVSGTLVFTDTLKKSLSGQAAKSYDGVAVSVESYGQTRNDDGQKEGDPGISQQTLDKVGGTAGVASVAGRVSGFAGVGDENGKLLGQGWSNKGSNFAPGKDGKDPRTTFTDGVGPAGADQIALDKETAAAGAYRVGDKVRVATNGPVKEYTLSGVFTTEDGEVKAGGSLVLFTTPAAQAMYLKPGFYQELSVAAKAGTSADKLLSDITPLLGKNAHAQTGAALADQQAKDIQTQLGGMSNMLLTFAGISLFVGVFLIYNTFTMLVSQRTRELALLRAIGAARGQVMRSVLAEALVIGVISAVIGLVTGIGLAIGMRSTMNAFDAKLPGGDLVIAPATIVAALVIGVVVTVVAAVLPAWRTGRIAPVAAMGSAHLPASSKSLMLRNTFGGILGALGFGLVFLGVSQGGGDGRWSIGGGAFFLLLGLIVLLPLLSRPVIGALRPPLEKVFGVPGKLAAQNAVRNPRRTAVTAASLAIGLTLVTSLSVLGITMGKAIDRLSTDKIKADYRVSMSEGVRAGGLDKSVAEALSKAPGIKDVTPVADGSFRVGDDFRSASGVNSATLANVLRIETVSGSLNGLGTGEIAVAEKEAEQRNLSVGSTLDARFDDGQKASLKVGAVYKDAEGLVSSYLIDNKVLSAHTEAPYVRYVYVNTDGGASAAGEKKVVEALGKNPAMTVATQQDMRDELGGMINIALNIMYGLLGMALIISVLGVVNTLAMSVFERTQEIGMLRAIGLDRGRVKNMIRLEAVVISLFGAILGVGIGVFLAWAVGSTLTDTIPGYALVLPWDRIGIFLLLAAVVGVLAAMWPARSAARLNMLTAIKTE